MSKPNRLRMLSQEALAKSGHPLACAIGAIAVLSAAIAVILYGEILHGGPLANAVENPAGWLVGFVLYMLLTIGYLTGKSWTVARSQRQLMERLLEAASSCLDISGDIPVHDQRGLKDETVPPIPVPSTSL